MVFNPRWLNWLEEDEEGNLTILKKIHQKILEKNMKH